MPVSHMKGIFAGIALAGQDRNAYKTIMSSSALRRLHAHSLCCDDAIKRGAMVTESDVLG
jgi:hypothetical protein